MNFKKCSNSTLRLLWPAPVEPVLYKRATSSLSHSIQKQLQDFKPPINHLTMASTSNALILGNDAVEIYDPSTHVIEDYGSYKKAKVDNSASPRAFMLSMTKSTMAHHRVQPHKPTSCLQILWAAT